MRTIITWTAVFVTLTALAFAGVPQTINYQGYLKNTAGAPVSTAVNVTFRLYSSGSGVNPLWSGTPQSVTPSNGIYSTQIGPTSLPFDRRYYLGVTVDPDPELRPLQQLDAVPYALKAAASETSTAIAGQTLTQLDSRYISPTEPKATVQQIATLRWDKVSGGINSYTVGTNPYSLAFDGSSIWVANGGSNNVMKINPASGAILGTYPVGTNPYALAFDGSSIWVANWSNNNVMKINPASGAIVGTYPVGTKPYGMAFDGSSIWVSNIDSHNVTKIDSVSGAIMGTYPAGTNPYALAFDGSNIWVANITSNNVTKINPATGAKVGTYDVGSTPYGLAYDGSSIWVANRGSDNIMKINPASGAIMGTYPVGSMPWALVFAGGSIWVSNYGGSTVMRIDPANGLILGTYSVGSSPVALAFDGSSIWVANYSSNSVSRLLHAGQVLAPATVGALQLTPNSVDTLNIINGAVSTSKIADSSVTDAKISGVVSPSKGGTGLNTSATATGSLLRTTGTGTWGTLPPGTNGQVLKMAAGAPAWGTDSSNPGTVTSITAGTGLTGGTITGSGTLAIDSVVVPKLSNGNVFTGTQIIQTGAAGLNGLMVQGVSGQVVNLQEWLNGAGTAVATVSPTGGFTGDGSGLSGVQKKITKVAIVAQSGGDYTSPLTAMSNVATWCGTPSTANPCLMKIMPGSYDIGTSTLVMQQYVDIEGSGENVTIIYSRAGDNGVVLGASNAELRNLTFKNMGPSGGNVKTVKNMSYNEPKISHVTAIAYGGSNNVAIYNYSASPVITDVTVLASGGTMSIGIYNDTNASPTIGRANVTATSASTNYGISNLSYSSPNLTDVTVEASYGADNRGLMNHGNCNPVVRNVKARASGGMAANYYGVYNSYSAPDMHEVIAQAEVLTNNGTLCNGMYNIYSAPTLNNVTAASSGCSANYGINNNQSNPEMFNIRSTARGGTNSYGIYSDYGGTLTGSYVSATNASSDSYGIYISVPGGGYQMRINSSVIAGKYAVWNSTAPGNNTSIGNSQLDGIVNNLSTILCIGSYDGTFTALKSNCLP